MSARKNDGDMLSKLCSSTAQCSTKFRLLSLQQEFNWSFF